MKKPVIIKKFQDISRRGKIGRSKFGQSKFGKFLGINARRKNISLAVEEDVSKAVHIIRLSGKNKYHTITPGKLKDVVNPKFNTKPKRTNLNPKDFTETEKSDFSVKKSEGTTRSRVVFQGKSDIGSDRKKK